MTNGMCGIDTPMALAPTARNFPAQDASAPRVLGRNVSDPRASVRHAPITGAPKARTTAAQGNALGSDPRITGALKGWPNFWQVSRRFRSPFQGLFHFRAATQGVALGCDRLGLWPAEMEVVA